MEEVFLTEEQKQNVLQEWNARPDNPPSLLELIKVAGFENKDGRSKEGRAVKQFLATRKIKAHGAHEYQAKKKINLTDEDKEFIVNNMAFMKPMEMARVVFKDPNITVLHQETRTINEYVKSLGPEMETYQNPEEIPNKEYKPPNTFDRLIARINKYVHHGINKDKITPKQKKENAHIMIFLRARPARGRGSWW